MSQAVTIEVQVAVTAVAVPDAEQLRAWAARALQQQAEAAELVIRVVDEAEITALNRAYRGKDGPTNVLSFPSELPAEVDSTLLGDIIICAPVVARECVLQDKAPEAHWAHLVIHGVLHLLGFDHQTEGEAARMEATEIRLLDELGFSDPYREMA
jgi:probable rRNA maturation factor